MYVNPFWFGLLIGMIVLLVLSALISHIAAKKEEEKMRDLSEAEMKEAIDQMNGKMFRFVERDGYLVGEPIEEDEDKDGDV